MKTSKVLISILLFAAVAGALVFQNCARSHYNDPDPNYSDLVRRQCQVCDDGTGSGLKCADTNGACVYESCNSGFQISAKTCVPVLCRAGAVASCVVPHGEGRKTCQSDNNGYDACQAISCEVGFQLQDGACVAVVVAVCELGLHRDCSTASTNGTETCNTDGSAYNACVFDSCKPGYNKDHTPECVANVCNPTTITPCTSGVGMGFQTCNSQGSAWGSCELNGCQSGYTLTEGVCVTQICSPNEESVCSFDHGTGTKLCNTDGSSYGACTLVGCNSGYTMINGQCVQQACVPGSSISCHGESGTGLKTCNSDGQAYGSCVIKECDSEFKLYKGQCVSKNLCESDENFSCTGENGSGLRECKGGHQIGPCVMHHCNDGFELVNQGNSPACKKIPSKGKN